MRLEMAQFREKQNLSQSNMAVILGVSKSLYSKIEEGSRNPQYEFVMKFIERFPEIDVRRFFYT